MNVFDRYDPSAPQTTEEWIASANTLGELIGDAVLRAEALPDKDRAGS